MEQLRSADRLYRQQKSLTRSALVAARQARYGSLPKLTLIVAAAQREAAQLSADGVGSMLREQGIKADPVGEVDPSAFSGVASDGRNLATLLDFTRTPGFSGARFDRLVQTQVADAGRLSASAAITSRPKVGGYVRMLNPPSCSRCALLAGKFYRWNSGFSRHPGCDCRHIPTSERVHGDLTVDPGEYFNSLSTFEQDRIFTKAGAQAIRDGADITQVVNARRGMTTAQVDGRRIGITTEGTTRRGMSRRSDGRARLMPETIYQVADNRQDAIRLLRLYGYIH